MTDDAPDTPRVGWLFSENRYSRVSYSKHFKRTYDDEAGDGVYRQTDIEFIPSLPQRGVAQALENLRSGVSLAVRDRQARLYVLDDDPREWGPLADFVWYNILLGPYAWGAQRSLTAPTVEDSFDDDGADLDEPAEMTVLPRFDSDMSYHKNTILQKRGPSEAPTYFGFTYATPSDDAIANYVRSKRKEFDQSGKKFMFVLFHNLLVPYVLG